ncbi:MAG: NAD(FAD)-utilizing dehydrogenase [Clostridiales Family XIII bacterium]|jgi:uncharacterized FAD-dependent dehydrogenase|nr:NAD(FAD)-utilizing dehydrogenase [Clostridiales Family XIII bacterium]
MLRIRGIKLKPGEPDCAIPLKIAKRCGLKKFGYEVSEWRIASKSPDARDKEHIHFALCVDFSVKRIAGRADAASLKKTESASDIEANIIRRLCTRGGRVDIGAAPPVTTGFDAVTNFHSGRAERRAPAPIIAGFGPCGMFAALVLAAGGLAPVVLERGKDVDERVLDVNRFFESGELDPESNVQFGEGGAGTFSDGKLTTGIKNPRARAVLAEFARAGGGDNILYDGKPHIGTDALRSVVKNIRERIIALGGTVLFGHRLDGLLTYGGALRAVLVATPRGVAEMPAERLILATGHSARDTFSMLRKAGLFMEPKPFSVGLRIEHPQRIIDTAQYGERFAEIYGLSPRDAGLPPADYKLSTATRDGRGVYTFCMCPGGVVIPAASEPGCTVTNGMSEKARAGDMANSALLVDVRVSDFTTGGSLAGIEFQRAYERAAFISKAAPRSYAPPSESLKDFMTGESALAACLPLFAVSAIRESLPLFGNIIKGFDMPEARLYGVETRSSSPIRVPRGQDMLSNIRGVYAGGEGAGKAGGIVSAAVDGVRIAETVLSL